MSATMTTMRISLASPAGMLRAPETCRGCALVLSPSARWTEIPTPHRVRRLPWFISKSEITFISASAKGCFVTTGAELRTQRRIGGRFP
eukprot:4142906-Pyramimonas_sp.AAC.1